VRVVLFFDGKNFFRSLCFTHPKLEIDYDKLARWVTLKAGGPRAEFAGAYYYTGYSEGRSLQGKEFSRFLCNLNLRHGYFVRREPRVRRRAFCPRCRRNHSYRTEKRVDSRLVAEMIQYAAVHAYDVAVLFSGDQDLVPAVEAVDRLGKHVIVATWRGRGLSPELRARCFDQIDLSLGVDSFKTGRQRKGAVRVYEKKPSALSQVPSPGSEPARERLTAQDMQPQLKEQAIQQPLVSTVLKELEDAETKLPQVSRWYFENRWRGKTLPPPGSVERKKLIEDAISQKFIEEFSPSSTVRKKMY